MPLETPIIKGIKYNAAKIIRAINPSIRFYTILNNYFQGTWQQNTYYFPKYLFIAPAISG